MHQELPEVVISSWRERGGENALAKWMPLAFTANMCLQKFLQEMGVRLGDMTKCKHSPTLFPQTQLCL